MGPVPEFSHARALNPYDLVLVKLTLGRPKDIDPLKALVDRRLIQPEHLREHYQSTPLNEMDAAKIGRNMRLLFTTDKVG